MTDNERDHLFGVLIARLLEDGLSRDIETSLFRACALLVRDEAIRELERRADEERAIDARGSFILRRIEHSLDWLRRSD